MATIRWRAAVRQLSGRSTPLTTRISTRAAGSCTNFRPRTSTPAASARDQVLQSRVSIHTQSPISRQFSPSFKKACHEPPSIQQSPFNHQILHSAFPTKTVIALIIIGAAAYYLIDVRVEDWADHALQSFNGDLIATPLHFYKDRDEVDHGIQYHLPDNSAPLRDPEVLRQYVERFGELQSAWAMNEEDSREFGIPVTHGIRFRSNEPCVSRLYFVSRPALSTSLLVFVNVQTSCALCAILLLM